MIKCTYHKCLIAFNECMYSCNQQPNPYVERLFQQSLNDFFLLFCNQFISSSILSPRQSLFSLSTFYVKVTVSESKIMNTSRLFRQETCKKIAISIFLTNVSPKPALFSCLVVSDSFATPWTVACQAPLIHGIFQAKILERVAISSSRESS